MGRILVKEGVDFGPSLAPAGARILDVLKQVAVQLTFDVTITSARDGEHSGPQDPHHSGEAFDLRTKGLTTDQAARLLHSLQDGLYRPIRRFYAFIENPGLPNEHIHCQRRSGYTYSVDDYLNNL